MDVPQIAAIMSISAARWLLGVISAVVLAFLLDELGPQAEQQRLTLNAAGIDDVTIACACSPAVLTSMVSLIAAPAVAGAAVPVRQT